MHWPNFWKGVIFSLYTAFLSLTTFSLAFQLYQENRIATTPMPTTPPLTSPAVLAATATPPTVNFPSARDQEPPMPTLNILLLGLDSRKEDKSARCDAIHMISLKGEEKKIIITSVPRGTIASNGHIVANNCSLYGFDIAVKEIEKITGIKADRVVKIGFSQAQGLMRLVDLPAAPTLQFLRNRKSYSIGDNQRSYNQAVFLKDIFLQYADLAAQTPLIVQRLAFEMLDTDLTFEEAQKIFRAVYAHKIHQNPENIILQTKPAPTARRQEIHFQEIISNLDDWQNDPEFIDYQKNLLAYLENIIRVNNRAKIKLAVEKQLWLQIEDAEKREEFRSKLLQIAQSF